VQDSVLRQKVPVRTQFCGLLTVPRIIVCILAVPGFFLRRLVSEDTFARNAVNLDSVVTHKACLRLCQKSVTDKNFAKQVGGHGLCNTVKFELCEDSKTKVECKTPDQKWKESMDDHEYVAKCTFKVGVKFWKPYAVICMLVISITMIIEGVEAEVVLLGSCCILAALGVLTSSQALGGIGSSSVLGLAVLFPIASAMDETGFLDRAISVLLGQPDSLVCAIPRMMVPVALLSGFFNNTPIVAMLIPVVVSWSRRLQCHPGKLLMPLSYAAQLGGSITVMGSSTTMMAREAVSSYYEMALFSPAPTALPIAVLTTLVVALLSPTRLLQSSAREETDNEGDNDNKSVAAYEVRFCIQQGGALDGAALADVMAVLNRIPGVNSAERIEASSQTRTQGVSFLSDDGMLHHGAVIHCRANSEGIAALRRIRGLELATQKDSNMLGTGRRHRNLYECVVARHGLPSMQAYRLRNDLGLALVAVRRPGQDRAPWLAGCGEDVQQEDVVLVEADSRFLVEKSDGWSAAFTLLTPVRDSSPPRCGTDVDFVKAVFTCVGMLALVLATGLNILPLEIAAGILLLLLLAIKAVSLKEAYSSIKVNVLLVIVGASGMAAAMEKTGVAGFIAAKVMILVQPGGAFAVYAAVYFLSFFLSMWINNTATVAILAPMLVGMQESLPNAPVANFVFVMVMGAGSCFTSPLGYQTNMMVMPDGQYVFNDFLRFGIPVQLVHGLLTVFLVPLIVHIIGG